MSQIRKYLREKQSQKQSIFTDLPLKWVVGQLEITICVAQSAS